MPLFTLLFGLYVALASETPHAAVVPEAGANGITVCLSDGQDLAVDALAQQGERYSLWLSGEVLGIPLEARVETCGAPIKGRWPLKELRAFDLPGGQRVYGKELDLATAYARDPVAWSSEDSVVHSLPVMLLDRQVIEVPRTLILDVVDPGKEDPMYRDLRKGRVGVRVGNGLAIALPIVAGITLTALFLYAASLAILII